MNRLTEQEQKEILEYIAFHVGTGPEPDWQKLPRWLVETRERGDRLEAMVDRMSEAIAECVLLIRPMYNLCGQIEKCGASVELTEAVTMADDIMRKLMKATGTKQLPPEV